jgi:hypothetical protein
MRIANPLWVRGASTNQTGAVDDRYCRALDELRRRRRDGCDLLFGAFGLGMVKFGIFCRMARISSMRA